MWCLNVFNYVKSQGLELLERAKCDDSNISMVPTFLWAVGAAALAQRLISLMFRRFLFRRVPWWEIIIQHLLFMWMIIYSLHFWAVVVNVMKFLVEYCYKTDDGSLLSTEEVESCRIMQQWMIWMSAAVPIAVYIQTRPKPIPPPLMMWITTNPWQRREMGAYGYYLSRPVSSIEPPNLIRQEALLRRAFSDSRVIKEPPKKKRNSKSV